MRAVQKHLGMVMLLVSCAMAQNPTPSTVQNVTSSRQGGDLRIEITLSAPVKPSVETAENPHRILLDFPDTNFSDKIRSVEVNANGVKRVRTAQHSSTPLITRVVLDLDESHPYVVSAEGNRIVLTIGAVEKARSNSRGGAPAAATSGNLIGIFRRKRETSIPSAESSQDNTALVPPPTVQGPQFEPPSETSNRPTGSAVASDRPASVPQSPPTTPLPSGSTGQTTSDQAQVSPAQKTASSTPQALGATRPVPPPPAIPTELVKQAEKQSPSIEIAANVAAPPVAAEPTPEPSAPAETTAPENTEPVAPEHAEATLIARSDDPNLKTVFRVKYVADGVAYLEGGRAQGLAQGMKLLVLDKDVPATQGDSANNADPRVAAELEVNAVAEMSSVTDIHTPKRPVKVGDLAYLSSSDAEALVQQRALSATRQYPAVISFTEGDTLDEEARQEIPRPPPPSVNRARGRIGFDTIETISHGASSVSSSDVGVVFRGDITRIGGTYWNLSGYWRGQLTKASAASQQTLQNLINRTYHLNMTYDNPNSTLVAGFGRLYLPWAPSLDTIDGGYFGKRLRKGTVLGVFGGSTPDPSSWDYSPDRVIGGSFINFEGGEYDGFHYSSTSGAGVSMVKWSLDRPFVFFEDMLSYKRLFSVYESAQLDSPRGNTVAAAPGAGLGRNFFTFRVNPHPRAEVDFNYNYFRDIPTFDTTLVGTGLLDKYLFQGFSAGGRVEVWNQIWLSTNLGRSNGTGDAKTSLNQMYGITFGRLPWVRLRADAHYSKFSGSFGNGTYESFSLSKQMSDRLRLEVLVGQQNFASTLTTNNRSRFVTGTVETTLGPHYYLQSNFTTNRGDMSYDQMMFSIGYRFDNRRKGE